MKMGKRGPKGKTVEQHVTDGPLREGRHGKMSLMPEFDTVKGWRNPPAMLSNAGKREWRRWAPELIKKGVLKELNVPPFCVLCECQARLKAVIKEEALFDLQYQERDPSWTMAGLYVNANGNIIPNPKSQERHQLELKLMKLWAEFGMTPTSRRGLIVEKEAEVSPWARFDAQVKKVQ